MAAKTERGRRINNALLLLLFAIPGFFWWFAATMASDLNEARALSERITGEVVEQVKNEYSCKDSDGKRRTCTNWLYKVRFDMLGDKMTRQLMTPRFDPKYIEHVDGIDHETQTVGTTMNLLLRRDLDYAVAPDSYWAAYLTPLILAGGGCFAMLFVVVGISLGWERAKRREADAA
ncbi:MAG: hypothetical protein AAFN27_07625 [Pseudomonadota bacterium]